MLHAFTVETTLGVLSSESSLDLMLWFNGSAGQLACLRYWFHFRGMAFDPVAYCFCWFWETGFCSVSVTMMGMSFLSRLFLQCCTVSGAWMIWLTSFFFHRFWSFRSSSHSPHQPPYSAFSKATLIIACLTVSSINCCAFVFGFMAARASSLVS